MLINSADLEALILSLKLASITTLILLLLCIPLAFYLAFSKSWLKPILITIFTLPMVLPPSVLGFYLLLFTGSNSILGQLFIKLGISPLPFTFSGLVLASVIYSLPFVLQPIYNSFKHINPHTFDLAALMGASKLDAFFNAFLPQAKLSILSGAILGFAHTMGEFGVVLMIGGNIPHQTQVISLQIYNHVESFEYGAANLMSFVLLSFSFITLIIIYFLQQKSELLYKT